MMEMTGTGTAPSSVPVGGVGGNDGIENGGGDGTHHHDQLPPLEDVKLRAEQEHSANDNLKRRLHYSYMGLGIAGLALLLTIIIAITTSSGGGGGGKSTDFITLSAPKMKTAIQEEAYSILSFNNPSDYEFLAGKPQARALAKVQQQAHKLTYSQTVEQYALWCLFYHTNQGSTTAWNNNQPITNSDNHDWCLFGGIRCNRKGKIVELVLTDLKLTGWIPEEILLLKDLHTINLSGNTNLGTTDGASFPTWLMLKPTDNIKRIDLRKTGYKGNVPDSVCNAKPFSMMFYVDCPYRVTCNCCDGCN